MGTDFSKADMVLGQAVRKAAMPAEQAEPKAPLGDIVRKMRLIQNLPVMTGRFCSVRKTTWQTFAGHGSKPEIP
jgi:hypothetical protein